MVITIDETNEQIDISTTDLSVIKAEYFRNLKDIRITAHDDGISVANLGRLPIRTARNEIAHGAWKAAKMKGRGAAPGVSVPRTAEQVATLFFPRDMRESALGDLEQEFHARVVPKFGKRFARFWYWFQVFRSLLPLAFAWLAKVGAVVWLGKAATWLMSKFST